MPRLHSIRRPRILFTAIACLVPAALLGCEEQLPVGIVDGELPGEPITIEVTIPWSDFAANLEVFGGYGSVATLSEGVVAQQYDGTLDAHTLLRFGAYPTQATVRDSTGTNRPDTDLTFFGGRLVAFFDTIASTNGSTPVTLQLGATQEQWDVRSTSWDFAVDSIGEHTAWTVPGGGAVEDLGTNIWDPTAGDSVVFDLDSATIAAWSDPLDLTAGARIDIVDPGYRLHMNGAVLRLDVRPSIDPDTTIVLNGSVSAATFVYTPAPPAPADGIRIGGAPSWRSVLDVSVPAELDGITDFCAVVSCPHTLTPIEISYAALVLTSRATEVPYAPTDSLRLDVRPVLNRAAMPKSPLGESLIVVDGGAIVGGSAFGALPGTTVEIPFTSYARDLLRGEDEAGNAPVRSLALLSVIEPFSISYASFEGPGGAGEPVLKLVLTIGPPVELP